MEQNIIFLIVGVVALVLGVVVGYYVRQSIAKKRAGTLEARLEKRVADVKESTALMIKKAEQKAFEINEKSEKEVDQRRKEFLRSQELLLSREKLLEDKISNFESKENELKDKVEKVRAIKDSLDTLRKEAETKLEKVANLSRDDAKKELLALVEIEAEKEIVEKMKKMEERGKEKLDKRAQEIVALAIQKCAVNHTQELSTTTFMLASEDLKGRIIGKEGRNIKTFEKITGVELIVDETPDSIVISCFNPIRRQIAKLALDKLVADGRIQPAKIEEKVEEAKAEISAKIKEAGEKAAYDTGIIGMHEKLIQILGRLYYRTSYGQNVLLHSIEMAFIAETIAEELGANSQIAKRAALLHDIGKAIDQQMQGSHIEIGIKILEKFGEKQEIINAMRAHHDDYPADTLEAVIVKVADAISGARPGARKDTIENYLQRLKNLEDIANRFEGVDRTYAIQAGREIRVFIKAEKVDDLGAQKMARQIAENIEEELKYPGEIKVTVIRETRVVEFAR
ncbi:MAG: ribonuclease Y [Candidatus Staskawiczbacteria bacterium RIFOXYB2_FULL_32_9]|uniref:Ribonuclease Y n=1 Tax=Candidatus Staskawiczbacteria bacterium RIFOXYD1_FULL_32_13 TaxID=1802234 RepID=A0A1G2JS75_9BACT|nr:MAG: Ribonuclease Y [Parcubacteria group bacterium GW2011_GWC2_32_10]OGV11417.1 MAG: ribonuclease Y [Stygiobacter sp. RIFOXYA2_FULL_38_8]OGZ78382.1 MAG: ribonuclease Y [Candidatus Staskawiczbacteria bacterium RIFOXYB1_FULL_32_11]OGZ81354.1 MAG: ribonuclease Y [Candidatus Staskawiczbacteria bacterium RIFOXYB2_FULL_32_9]OGZ86744.1 MAG: ribonuclease Y [Candidatus Staskawiczbacteria bacterium RIFOXYC2_FULL_32_10]OGZ89783.1 MAG: ribonuclease Y [Candidatus Staskawiczbacteria bacterium RIFOXYD1_FU